MEKQNTFNNELIGSHLDYKPPDIRKSNVNKKTKLMELRNSNNSSRIIMISIVIQA